MADFLPHCNSLVHSKQLGFESGKEIKDLGIYGLFIILCAMLLCYVKF